jgi:pentose-5-phosphate-3-epimerase
MAFMSEVPPKIAQLRDGSRVAARPPIGIDGGVNLDTIGPAHAAGGEVLVAGWALYAEHGDLAPTVQALRSAASEDAG